MSSVTSSTNSARDPKARLQHRTRSRKAKRRATTSPESPRSSTCSDAHRMPNFWVATREPRVDLLQHPQFGASCGLRLRGLAGALAGTVAEPPRHRRATTPTSKSFAIKGMAIVSTSSGLASPSSFSGSPACNCFASCHMAHLREADVKLHFPGGLAPNARTWMMLFRGKARQGTLARCKQGDSPGLHLARGGGQASRGPKRRRLKPGASPRCRPPFSHPNFGGTRCVGSVGHLPYRLPRKRTNGTSSEAAP